MSQERSPIAPDLPTFKEQGHDITMSSLRGIGAPKGLPADVKAKLVRAVQQAVQDPAFREKAQAMYAPLRYLGPKEYEAELQANETLFRNFWKETPWAEN
jgi:tripartite-type tricarboxylate transporter receptor subunit TctC